MTQKDLAHCLKVHQPSVSAWELGKTLPAPGTMLELAKLFNLNLSNLTAQPRRRPRKATPVGTDEIEVEDEAESVAV